MGAVYHRLDRPSLLPTAAQLPAHEKVVGWFNGRIEFGPRALGTRSILSDPRSPRMRPQTRRIPMTADQRALWASICGCPIDALVLGLFLLHKQEQPAWEEKQNWKREFQLGGRSAGARWCTGSRTGASGRPRCRAGAATWTINFLARRSAPHVGAATRGTRPALTV